MENSWWTHLWQLPDNLSEYDDR